MEKKLTLSTEIILNEEFPKESLGYSIEKINKFLDVIAEDYEKFHEIETELNNHVLDLKQIIQNLKTELANLASDNTQLKSELEDIKKGGSPDFADLIKRVNALETNNAKTSSKISDVSDKIDKVFNKVLEKISEK